MQVVTAKWTAADSYNLQTSYTVSDSVRLGECSRQITLHNSSHTFFNFLIQLDTIAYIINYNNAPIFVKGFDEGV
jgi:hypothetical protein